MSYPKRRVPPPVTTDRQVSRELPRCIPEGVRNLILEYARPNSMADIVHELVHTVPAPNPKDFGKQSVRYIFIESAELHPPRHRWSQRHKSEQIVHNVYRTLFPMRRLSYDDASLSDFVTGQTDMGKVRVSAMADAYYNDEGTQVISGGITVMHRGKSQGSVRHQTARIHLV